MNKIKILKAYYTYSDNSGNDYYDSGTYSKTIGSGETDWELVSDEELKILLAYICDYNKSLTRYSSSYHQLELVQQVTIEPTSIADFLERTKIEEEKRLAKEKKQQKENAIRAKKLAATAIERKRKKLEKLQKELESEEIKVHVGSPSESVSIKALR